MAVRKTEGPSQPTPIRLERTLTRRFFFKNSTFHTAVNDRRSTAVPLRRGYRGEGTVITTTKYMRWAFPGLGTVDQPPPDRGSRPIPTYIKREPLEPLLTGEGGFEGQSAASTPTQRRSSRCRKDVSTTQTRNCTTLTLDIIL